MKETGMREQSGTCCILETVLGKQSLEKFAMKAKVT